VAWLFGDGRAKANRTAIPDGPPDDNRACHTALSNRTLYQKSLHPNIPFNTGKPHDKQLVPHRIPIPPKQTKYHKSDIHQIAPAQSLTTQPKATGEKKGSYTLRSSKITPRKALNNIWPHAANREPRI
jgi:hypothetical protein